jgi:hypothetical protein
LIIEWIDDNYSSVAFANTLSLPSDSHSVIFTYHELLTLSLMNGEKIGFDGVIKQIKGR